MTRQGYMLTALLLAAAAVRMLLPGLCEALGCGEALETTVAAIGYALFD